MALTGLEIYKLLPKTNCKECGFPTCLAFAMKLSQKGTDLDKCPSVSDEAKAALEAAATPPIKLVAIGSGERAFEIGNEVVLFRHEKTFYHQSGLVVRVKSDDPQLAEVAGRVAGYEVERVGIKLSLDGLAVEHAGGDAAAYAAAVAAARAAAPDLPLVLMSGDAAAIDAALSGGAAADRPLIHAATAANWQAMAEVAAKHGCPLAIRAEAGDLAGLVDLSENVRGAGVEDLLLDPGASRLAGDSDDGEHECPAAHHEGQTARLGKGGRVAGEAGGAGVEQEVLDAGATHVLGEVDETREVACLGADGQGAAVFRGDLAGLVDLSE